MENLEIIFTMIAFFVLIVIIVLLLVFNENHKSKLNALGRKFDAKVKELDAVNVKLDTALNDSKTILEKSVKSRKLAEGYNQMKIDLDTIISDAKEANRLLHNKVNELQEANSDSLLNLLEKEKTVTELYADNKYLKSELSKVLQENQELGAKVDKKEPTKPKPAHKK